MMTKPFPKSALLIAGPTASGKSALAIAEAKRRNGVIINADSMQVYRELRLLTARPSLEEEAMVPHKLYGHVSGSEKYSVAGWLRDVETEMARCWQAGQLPILCGGTGLYFKAALEGLAEVPPIDPAVREKWRNFSGDVHQPLTRLDPETAARLNPADRQRIVRALEVIEGTGQTLRHWQDVGHTTALLNQINVERVFVDVSREVLHQRAEQRFDQMMEQGALAEVKALPAFDPTQPLMKAIGVPELLAHLRGESTRDEAVLRAKAATRQYIKRQTTWWRGQMQGWTTFTPA